MSNLAVKISNDFRDRYEFARTHISRETVLLQLSLILITSIAFLIRFEGAFIFDWGLGAGDPYLQLIAARVIDSHIDTVGFFNSLISYMTYVDPSMWYPNPGIRDLGASQHIAVPLTAVFIRRLFMLFGFNFTIDQAAFLAPGFFGSLSVPALYFLGKEISNKKVGLLAAFLLAFNSGNMQRSLVGFFDNEEIGVLLFILTIYFFLRALKSGSFITPILAGLSLAGLFNAWGAAIFLVQFLSIYALTLILLKKYSQRLLNSFSIMIFTNLAFAILFPSVGPKLLLSTEGFIPLGLIGIMLVISLYQEKKENITQLPYMSAKNLELASYSLVILGFIFILFNTFFPIFPTFNAKFITVVLPFFRSHSPILDSVAEQQIIAWGSLFQNFFLLLFLLPIAVMVLYKKPTENNIFLLMLLLISLYFSFSEQRLIVILAPVAVLASAKAIDEILTPFAQIRQEKFFLSKRKRTISKSLGQEHVSIAFIVIFGILAITFLQGITIDQMLVQPPDIFMQYKTSSSSTYTTFGDWFQTLDWLQRNTPQNSVIASWWDYGYYLTLANRTIISDGATLNSTQIGNIGAMLMSTPDYSLKIASYYDVDYIVVLTAAGSTSIDNDIGKVQWMVKIAEASGTLDKTLGHPILSKNFFKYDTDGKTITSYANDFFKSLIWAFMTDGVDSQTLQGFQSNYLVKSTLTTTGYAPGYEIYRQVFQPVFMSNNAFLRVIKIDWNLAGKLFGVAK